MTTYQYRGAFTNSYVELHPELGYSYYGPFATPAEAAHPQGWHRPRYEEYEYLHHIERSLAPEWEIWHE